MNAIAAASVPAIMNGVRLPSFVFVLSEIAPNNGSRKIASTLSRAITTPEAACDIPNLSVSILGIIVSYACQNVQIRKKAKPTKIVRL